MKTEHLHLQPVDDTAAWDALVERSPQGTVFAKSAHLRALALPHERLAVMAGQRVVALLPLVLAGDGRSLLRPPYTPHLGLLFLPDAQATLARQRIDDEFTLTEWVIACLTRRFERIELALAPGFDDLRPFLWHNYHEPGQGQFRVALRYTALLPLVGVDRQSVRAAARACRRQEEKKALGAPVIEPVDTARFLDLYARTFARQQLGVGNESLATVNRITTQAVNEGWGRLAGCETTDGLAAAALFVYDQRRAYYLFAANAPELRHTGAATRLMFDHLDHALARGLHEVDLVGVNSPNRGDFKLSFNPQLRSYYELSWARAEVSAQ